MAGTQKHWLDGLPYDSLSGDGAQKHWHDGLPHTGLVVTDTTGPATQWDNVDAWHPEIVPWGPDRLRSPQYARRMPTWAYGVEPIPNPPFEALPDMYWQQPSEPVRVRPNWTWLYPYSVVDASALLSVEAPQLDKWFVRGPDPVRSRREAVRRRPWMDVAASWEPSTAGGAGGGAGTTRFFGLLGVGS